MPTPTPVPPRGMTVHDGALTDFDVPLVYALLALRTNVFVVEQDCAYPELDGRDLEAGARHVFLVDQGTDAIAAGLRCLGDHVDGQPVQRVGRVVTQPEHRGRGLARWLVDHVTRHGDLPTVLDAQSHLQPWYEALGFRLTGPGWLEDGIPHVPMRRDP